MQTRPTFFSRVFHWFLIVAFLAIVPLSFGGRRATILYAGGNGSSFEKAVVIQGATEETGVNAEMAWLAQHFPGYKNKQQALQEHGGRKYDVISINASGRNRLVYFDITGFFGK